MSLGHSALHFIARERLEDDAAAEHEPPDPVDPPAHGAAEAGEDDAPLVEPFTRRDVDLADIELQSRVFVLLVLIVGMAVCGMAAASYIGVRPEIGAIAGTAAAILSPRRKPK